MKVTTYGQKVAKAEPVPAPHPLGGATAHMHACQYDAGIRVLLTGEDTNGKPIRRYAKSIYGAFMQMQAAHGINRAWQILPDDSRKLLIVR